MDFIVNNYIWFIISGMVLLFITIGYYADKTNFGKNGLDGTNKNNDSNSDSSTTISNVVLNNVPLATAIDVNAGVSPHQTLKQDVLMDNIPINNVSNSISNTDAVQNKSSIKDVNDIDNVPFSVDTFNSKNNVNVNQSSVNPEPNVTIVNESESTVNNSEQDIWKF